MGLLPNLNLPLPLATDLMAVWSTGGIITQSTAWPFSSLADIITAASTHYDGVHVIWIAPVLASTNWVWSEEPG